MRAPYHVVSADSHLEISANMWRDRVPEPYRAHAPKTVRLPDGSDAWEGEKGKLHLASGVSSLVAGVPFDQWRQEGAQYERSYGAGPPEQRLAEQDADGIDAEVLYPSVGGRSTINLIADEAAYVAVVRVYNTWLAQEYCAANPGRLIGLGILPERGVAQAIAEMEHCAELGLKGVCIGMFPNGSARPAPEDDAFWRASLAMSMPVTIHDEIAEREGRAGEGGLKRVADLARRICTYGCKGAPAVARFAIDGVFRRFPELQIYVAENQIGWLPNFYEQMDILWDRHRHWMERDQELEPLDKAPSEYIRTNVLWGFMDNPFGVKIRHDIGVDRVMWSNDMPHSPTDWPHSVEVIERNMAGVPADERHLMLAGNATRFFQLDATYESTETREQRVAERRAGKEPELPQLLAARG
jgi:predicted TIM-barrel fold metal-dependent hydrolase